jgi:hypothetical protein
MEFRDSRQPLAFRFQRQIKEITMVNINPQNALRATESLLSNVIEMLIDAEGAARDGNLTDIVNEILRLQCETNGVLADVADKLSH